MAHPKRRQSKTRTAKRRTHDKAAMPTLAKCANCGEWHVYHTVCGACGYYRGKLAIEQDEAKTPLAKEAPRTPLGLFSYLRAILHLLGS